MRRLIGSITAIVLMAGMLMTTQSARAAQSTTTAGDVQVWNASLRLVLCAEDGSCPPGTGNNTSYWEQFFDRAADESRYPLMPDVFVLHEVPRPMRKTVMVQLRARVGGAWTYRHSDVADCASFGDCGNTMIAWRTDKLSYMDEHRWNLMWKPAQQTCRLSSTKAAVAVKLAEDGTNREIVVAGVHFYKLDNQACAQKNVRKAEVQLENKWPTRPLTVLSGDFNKMAHECGGIKHCSDVPLVEWRSERDADDSDDHEELACWYKGLGARYETSLDPDCSAFSFDASYYDAIWETESDAPTHGICASWTFDNVERTTDPEGATDTCRSRQKRIDFLWVGWEDASGNPIEFGAQEVPADKLVSANTDQGWHDVFADRYSDHRAMRALVSW